MALGSLAIETWLIALPATRKLLPCRDSAQQDWWVSLSHLSAKPASGFNPAPRRLGMQPPDFVLRQQRRTLASTPFQLLHQAGRSREKKEATPVTTTTWLCCKRKNSTRTGYLLKFQTFTHTACENVHFVWTKMFLKSPPALNKQFTWISNLLHLLFATNKRIRQQFFFHFSEKLTVFQSFADAVHVQNLLSTVRSKCIASAWPLEHRLNVLVKPYYPYCSTLLVPQKTWHIWVTTYGHNRLLLPL